jgi:small-conductance mechanosensitive channel
MIDTLIEGFISEYHSFIAFLPRLITALVAVGIVYLVGKMLASALIQILKRSSMPDAYHSYFSKLVKGTAIFIGLILFLNLIGYGTLSASLVAGGGLTAVMLGFAFKDIGENFLAGFFLAFSRPFNTDDIIETDGITGKVKSIHLRHTHIRTPEGCDVFVPSAQLFTKPLSNYTLDGLRRGSFTVGIDYADDISRALTIMLDCVKNTPGVLQSPVASTSIKGFTPNYVELQAFFWINARDQELGLARVKTSAMNNCRLGLIEEGFTLSSNVSTALTINPVDVQLQNKKDDKANND